LPQRVCPTESGSQTCGDIVRAMREVTAVNTPDVRVGDLDRQAAVDRLLAHTTAGRLTFDEFDTRAAAAYAARTRSELDRLFTDLPPLQHEAPRAGNALAGLLALLGLAAPALAGSMMAACM
jgi:hypothetical protein